MTRAARTCRLLRSRLPQLRERYGVHSLWLFGSQARGEARGNSDVDLLVEFDERTLSLIGFIELEDKLSDLLGARVDLVEKSALKPSIAAGVLQDARPI